LRISSTGDRVREGGLIYEIRQYEAVESKAEAMRERFINEVASRFFPRHGIELVGAFVGLNEGGRLTYVTRFVDETARAKAWAAFSADPEWTKVKSASELNGPLVEKQSATVLSPVISGLILD
jgi:hypothetical protein